MCTSIKGEQHVQQEIHQWRRHAARLGSEPPRQPAPHFARWPNAAYPSSIERSGNRRHRQRSAFGSCIPRGEGRSTHYLVDLVQRGVHDSSTSPVARARDISFHHLHHALTLSKLGFAYSAATTAADIEQKGILAAVRNLVVREMKR